MFFESLPPGQGTAAGVLALPELPAWSSPPALETGVVLAAELTAARSPNVVLRLPTIRAFSTGCVLDVEVVSRKGELSEDDWWDLHSAAFHHLQGARAGAPLPRKLLRLGVRYASGSKATTLDQRRRWVRGSDDPPAGPLLSWRPGSSSMSGRGTGFSGFGLWLWPLPPAEAFEFAVEWPFGGIEETIIKLDGAAIAAAASRSAPYWPEADEA